MKLNSYIPLLLEKLGRSDTQLLFLNYLKEKCNNSHSPQELNKSVCCVLVMAAPLLHKWNIVPS